MSELDKIISQIEELRLSTINVQESKSYTDSEVVAACHEILPQRECPFLYFVCI